MRGEGEGEQEVEGAGKALFWDLSIERAGQADCLMIRGDREDRGRIWGFVHRVRVAVQGGKVVIVDGTDALRSVIAHDPSIPRPDLESPRWGLKGADVC